MIYILWYIVYMASIYLCKSKAGSGQRIGLSQVTYPASWTSCHTVAPFSFLERTVVQKGLRSWAVVMPCRLYLVNCLANYSSYLIPRFYPLQFAKSNPSIQSPGQYSKWHDEGWLIDCPARNGLRFNACNWQAHVTNPAFFAWDSLVQNPWQNQEGKMADNWSKNNQMFKCKFSNVQLFVN